jgi:hypothetical protein
MIGSPPGFPRIPGAPDDLALPHKFERTVMLARPFTPDLVARACEAIGFSRPTTSLFGGAQRWQTTSPRRLGSLGETIEIEVISPLELVLRSESKLPAVPFLDWKKNSDNVEKLARALSI